MPGKLKRHEYDLVEEVYDSKIPVHNETAFEHGIRFKVKYIGSKEITKPSSRTEIVAAMRRIRYEYKIQGINKKIVELGVGLEGVRVARHHNKGNMFQKKKLKEVITEVTSYPIHKIFYVSHDSQDLQIFSYIAKDEDIFKCSVFKATNKSQAVHIVRTIGQAFEVCHKRTVQSTESAQTSAQDKQDGNVTSTLDKTEDSMFADKDNNDNTSSTQESPHITLDGSHVEGDGSMGLSVEKLRQIFQQQVDHYRQEAEAAKLESKLLNDKMNAETLARTEAQKQLEAVLKQNRELISTVQQLVSQVHSLHAQRHNFHANPNTTSLVLNHSNSSSLSSTPVLTQRQANPADSSGLFRRNLGEPMLPHIPPPTTSPSHSRQDSNASSCSFTSGVRLGSSLDRQGTPDIELSQSKRDPPPQEFFQFVFDSSVHSDYFPATSEPANNTSAVSEHAPWPNEGSMSVSMVNGPSDGTPGKKIDKVVNGT